MATILITGPARSGKSEWAEHLAHQSKQAVVYVATSRVDPGDVEWQARLDKHRARRPNHWRVCEVPVELVQVLQGATPDQCLLIDSLGTWLANLIELDDVVWQQYQDQFIKAVRTAVCDVILVGEETGWGIVPAYPMGRTFRDRLGGLVRQVGAIATSVYLVTGGYALDLKQLGMAISPSSSRPQKD
ncbi:MAG: bifunctional adenosylcobinamide kinase/adenosylcobinamide-phosphate guanylyltransferase [Cyanobacteria bacterium P01_D01_bin.44]